MLHTNFVMRAYKAYNIMLVRQIDISKQCVENIFDYRHSAAIP